jgi:acetamidase/formamidase
MPTIHTLEPERKNLIGCFSREHAPILVIQPGDTVRYRTLDADWGLEPFVSLNKPRRLFEPRTEDDKGHAVIGPVAIQGAHPGMTLEVHIGTIRPGPYGFCVAGGWPHDVNDRLGMGEGHRGVVHDWKLDATTMTGKNQHGHTVALRPFMGVLGMPPNLPGKHSTQPPRYCGGNIDCKELIAGTTLYLPISVEGALFYAGDGHAAQGDGEVSITAIECPMEQVELTFHLRDDLPLTMPRAETPTGWITLGFHEDLLEATYLALDGMLSLIGDLYQVDRADALALASLTVDMRITQIVNRVRGVHAFLPNGAIR